MDFFTGQIFDFSVDILKVARLLFINCRKGALASEESGGMSFPANICCERKVEEDRCIDTTPTK
eukprot:13758939-Ditylum_brightwellii.AAC.1